MLREHVDQQRYRRGIAAIIQGEIEVSTELLNEANELRAAAAENLVAVRALSANLNRARELLARSHGWMEMTQREAPQQLLSEIACFLGWAEVPPPSEGEKK